MSHLKTENLSYVYGEGTPFKITALDNVNIDLEKGTLSVVKSLVPTNDGLKLQPPKTKKSMRKISKKN